MLKKLCWVAALALLVACGSQEKGTTTSEGGNAPEASAPMANAPEAAAPEQKATEEKPAEAAPEASSGQLTSDGQQCLDLVAQGNFSEAVAVCTEALKNNPASDAVKQALATAKEKVGEAASAAGEAAGKAEGAAEGAAGEAASKLPGGSAPQQ